MFQTGVRSGYLPILSKNDVESNRCSQIIRWKQKAPTALLQLLILSYIDG